MLFDCSGGGSEVDRYKMSWLVYLRHRATGELLTLSDFKGGFAPECCLSEESRQKPDEREAFFRDVETLMTLLVHPRMPGNYDGTVAGAVA